MLGAGAGRFFGTLPLAPADAVPATVEVTATNVAQPNNDQVTRAVDVHDVVTISQADYDNAQKTPTIVATSSDQGSPPTLEALGFGALDCTDPASCTRTESDLNTVSVTPVNDNPTMVGDSAVTTTAAPVVVNVLANDTDVDGDALALTAVTQPANGTATVNVAALP